MTDLKHEIPSARAASDIWSNWLLYQRHGGDPCYRSTVKEALDQYADRVLKPLRLSPGMRLADIGAGDGLIAFRAIEQVGPALQVVLADISAPMLAQAELLAFDQRIHAQCRFVQCAAEDLSPLADSSMDALTTRSALAYVADKAKALREFFRVLKPGGRLSLAEPIMQDDAFAVRALRLFLEHPTSQTVHPFTRLLHRWKAAQFPDTDEAIRSCPLTNFSERDLIRMAHQAGFIELHLELHIDMAPSIVPSWDAFVASSPHPFAPPLTEILQQRFTAEERTEFERVLRPLIQDPKVLSTSRMAYLMASKPIEL